MRKGRAPGGKSRRHGGGQASVTLRRRYSVERTSLDYGSQLCDVPKPLWNGTVEWEGEGLALHGCLIASGAERGPRSSKVPGDQWR